MSARMDPTLETLCHVSWKGMGVQKKREKWLAGVEKKLNSSAKVGYRIISQNGLGEKTVRALTEAVQDMHTAQPASQLCAKLATTEFANDPWCHQRLELLLNLLSGLSVKCCTCPEKNQGGGVADSGCALLFYSALLTSRVPDIITSMMVPQPEHPVFRDHEEVRRQVRRGHDYCLQIAWTVQKHLGVIATSRTPRPCHTIGPLVFQQWLQKLLFSLAQFVSAASTSLITLQVLAEVLMGKSCTAPLSRQLDEGFMQRGMFLRPELLPVLLRSAQRADLKGALDVLEYLNMLVVSSDQNAVAFRNCRGWQAHLLVFINSCNMFPRHDGPSGQEIMSSKDGAARLVQMSVNLLSHILYHYFLSLSGLTVSQPGAAWYTPKGKSGDGGQTPRDASAYLDTEPVPFFSFLTSCFNAFEDAAGWNDNTMMLQGLLLRSLLFRTATISRKFSNDPSHRAWPELLGCLDCVVNFAFFSPVRQSQPIRPAEQRIFSTPGCHLDKDGQNVDLRLIQKAADFLSSLPELASSAANTPEEKERAVSLQKQIDSELTFFRAAVQYVEAQGGQDAKALRQREKQFSHMLQHRRAVASRSTEPFLDQAVGARAMTKIRDKMGTISLASATVPSTASGGGTMSPTTRALATTLMMSVAPLQELQESSLRKSNLVTTSKATSFRREDMRDPRRRAVFSKPPPSMMDGKSISLGEHKAKSATANLTGQVAGLFKKLPGRHRSNHSVDKADKSGSGATDKSGSGGSTSSLLSVGGGRHRSLSSIFRHTRSGSAADEGSTTANDEDTPVSHTRTHSRSFSSLIRSRNPTRSESRGDQNKAAEQTKAIADVDETGGGQEEEAGGGGAEEEATTTTRPEKAQVTSKQVRSRSDRSDQPPPPAVPDLTEDEPPPPPEIVSQEMEEAPPPPSLLLPPSASSGDDVPPPPSPLPPPPSPLLPPPSPLPLPPSSPSSSSLPEPPPSPLPPPPPTPSSSSSSSPPEEPPTSDSVSLPSSAPAETAQSTTLSLAASPTTPARTSKQSTDGSADSRQATPAKPTATVPAGSSMPTSMLSPLKRISTALSSSMQKSASPNPSSKIETTASGVLSPKTLGPLQQVRAAMSPSGSSKTETQALRPSIVSPASPPVSTHSQKGLSLAIADDAEAETSPFPLLSPTHTRSGLCEHNQVLAVCLLCRLTSKKKENPQSWDIMSPREKARVRMGKFGKAGGSSTSLVTDSSNNTPSKGSTPVHSRGTTPSGSDKTQMTFPPRTVSSEGDKDEVGVAVAEGDRGKEEEERHQDKMQQQEEEPAGAAATAAQPMLDAEQEAEEAAERAARKILGLATPPMSRQTSASLEQSDEEVRAAGRSKATPEKPNLPALIVETTTTPDKEKDKDKEQTATTANRTRSFSQHNAPPPARAPPKTPTKAGSAEKSLGPPDQEKKAQGHVRRASQPLPNRLPPPPPPGRSAPPAPGKTSQSATTTPEKGNETGANAARARAQTYDFHAPPQDVASTPFSPTIKLKHLTPDKKTAQGADKKASPTRQAPVTPSRRPPPTPGEGTPEKKQEEEEEEEDLSSSFHRQMEDETEDDVERAELDRTFEEEDDWDQDEHEVVACGVCDKLLAGTEHKYEWGDEWYCEQHYMWKLSCCADCEQPVEEGEASITISDKNEKLVVHPAHFRCTVCKRSFDDGGELQGQPCQLEGRKIYCEADWTKQFGKECAFCEEKVSDQGLNAFGCYFHPQHFLCGGVCGRAIKSFNNLDMRDARFSHYLNIGASLQTGDGKAFAFWRDKVTRGMEEISYGTGDSALAADAANMPFCTDCFRDVFLPSCHACKKKILQGEEGVKVEQGLLSEDLNFHVSCLKCCKPGCTVQGMDVQFEDDLLICATHLAQRGPPCTACGTPAASNEADPVVKIRDMLFHKRCVRCAVCASELGSQVFVHQKSYMSHAGISQPFTLLCTQHMREANAPKCASCQKAVVEDGAQLDGLPYHKACIACTICHTPLAQIYRPPASASLAVAGFYCEQHYREYFKSHGRNESGVHTFHAPATQTFHAPGTAFHPPGTPQAGAKPPASGAASASAAGGGHVGNGSATGSPSKNPAEEVCPMCQKEVERVGKFLSVTNQLYHQACFFCYQCKGKLDSQAFVRDDQRRFYHREHRPAH